jgi:hypothetical protein
MAGIVEQVVSTIEATQFASRQSEQMADVAGGLGPVLRWSSLQCKGRQIEMGRWELNGLWACSRRQVIGLDGTIAGRALEGHFTPLFLAPDRVSIVCGGRGSQEGKPLRAGRLPSRDCRPRLLCGRASPTRTPNLNHSLNVSTHREPAIDGNLGLKWTLRGSILPDLKLVLTIISSWSRS